MDSCQIEELCIYNTKHEAGKINKKLVQSEDLIKSIMLRNS